MFAGIASAPEAAVPSNCHAVWIGVSTNDGRTFTDHAVCVNPNTSVSYGHQFVNATVDAAGAVYAVYSDNRNLFCSYASGDGQSWTGPIQLNQSPSATAVMPWNVSCAPGEFEVVWYGTPYYDGVNVPDNHPMCAAWQVFFAQSRNAASATGSFVRIAATPVIHCGGVCESGVTCSGNRDPFDDFGIAASPVTGLASIVYSNDQPGNNGASDHTAIATQTLGRRICLRT